MANVVCICRLQSFWDGRMVAGRLHHTGQEVVSHRGRWPHSGQDSQCGRSYQAIRSPGTSTRWLCMRNAQPANSCCGWIYLIRLQPLLVQPQL